ncbi:MAG: hypothetical protein ACXVDZ_18195 [Bacteroidia bacterium]
MEDQKQNNPKQENQKAQPDKKGLSGTETEKEKSLLEKASDTIAGDSTLMTSVMKFLASPVILLVFGGIVIYVFSKIKKLKEEIEELKTQNKKSADEQKIMEEEYHSLKKKYKKLKVLNETEQQNFIGTKEQPSLTGLNMLTKEAPPKNSGKKKTYQSAYLD